MIKFMVLFLFSTFFVAAANAGFGFTISRSCYDQGDTKPGNFFTSGDLRYDSLPKCRSAAEKIFSSLVKKSGFKGALCYVESKCWNDMTGETFAKNRIPNPAISGESAYVCVCGRKPCLVGGLPKVVPERTALSKVAESYCEFDRIANDWCGIGKPYSDSCRENLKQCSLSKVGDAGLAKIETCK